MSSNGSTGNRVPTTPMIEEIAYIGFPDFGLPLPTYTDEQWGNFDRIFGLLPPFPAYAIEAYISHNIYTLEPVALAPSENWATSAAADTPPVQAGSPGGSSYGPSDGSESASPRGGYKTRYTAAGFEHGSNGGRRRAHRHTPYSVSERPSISPAKYDITTSTDSDSDEAFSSVFSFNFYRSPLDAAYLESPGQKIQEELDLLSAKLGELGIKQTRHHPYLTCPVFDCDQGGFNELLHGSTSALPVTTTTRRSASPSNSLNTGNELQYQPSGKFFSFHELARHVKTVHMPALDLRCSYLGCTMQAKLDNDAGGFGRGRFSRPDVMRTHLKNFKKHRSHIPDDLRAKYKLWKD